MYIDSSADKICILVQDLTPSSNAAKAGVQAGHQDVIANVDLPSHVSERVRYSLTIWRTGYGVFVQDVTPGSNAAKASIEAGDQVLSTSAPLDYNAGTQVCFYMAIKQALWFEYFGTYVS